MSTGRESADFVRRLSGSGRTPAPLPEGLGEPDRSSELRRGNRAPNEGKGNERQRSADYESRRFVAELTGNEFRDERYFD